MGTLIAVLTIIFAVGITGFVIGNYLYKEHKGKNHHGCDGSCSYVVKRGLKNVRKELEKEKNL